MSCYRLITLVFLLTALYACGSVAPAVPTPTADLRPTAQPRPADTLRWSLDGISDLPTLDPARPADTQTVTAINLVFGGLIRLNAQQEVTPDAASDWSVSADGTVYTFVIRDGLTFADGTPVTARDFVFSINRALAPEHAMFGAPFQLHHIIGANDVTEGRSREAAGVRSINDRVLEIRLDKPVAFFLAQLSYPYNFVVPENLVNTAGWEQRAYGTGPYRVERWLRNDRIVLAANERYWAGKPGIPQIELYFNPDSNTAFEKYLTGELDIVGNPQNPIPAARVPEVAGLPDFRSTAALVTRYLGFNNRLKPFDDPQVRRAFALAIDRTAIARDILGGTMLPADRILPAGMIGTQYPIRPLAFDPQRARATLVDAGYTSGTNVAPVTLTYAREGDNELVAQALQRQWQANLGIEVQLQPMSLEAFSEALRVTYQTPLTGIQLYYSVWGADYPDPQNFLSQQLRTGSPNNNGHFSNPEFDRLVDEADRLSDRTQIVRRLQLYNQAEQIAIEQVGWMPLFFPKINILMHPRIDGLQLTPNGLMAPDWTKVNLNG